MSTYEKLDAAILKSISEGKSPLHDSNCASESGRIAEATGREDFRVLDGRLQALRKSGRIRHLTKAEAHGIGGWHVVGKTI